MPGGTGGLPANAITFSGGTNYLELRAGYTINGNVVVQGGVGTLGLGGDAQPGTAFDVGEIGPAAQYQGFTPFLKTGASTWLLTGQPAQMTPWTIQQGTLAISSNLNLGVNDEVLTFNNPTA